jgi:3-phosphoshikimate 1-carboxyvinyltransferase
MDSFQQTTTKESSGKAFTVSAPASKSYLQRALAVSLLAKGITTLENVSWCDDSLAAKKIIESLGAVCREDNRSLIIKSKGVKFNEKYFSAGEAGLSIRMFSPILALSQGEVVFNGKGSLLKRPVKLIEDALKQFNVDISSNNGLLPLKIKGAINPGKVNIDGSLSSQLLTGLLITLPVLNGDSEIIVDNLKSVPYIDMTLSVIKDFGVEIENYDYKIFKIKGNQKYNPITFNIEGDWSGAAFWLVLGAVIGSVEVLNLNYNSQQADTAIITALKKAGAEVIINNNSVVVKRQYLKSFDFDATHCPDLFPPLVCLASQCEGLTKIKGVSRLTHKESNRAKVLQQEMAKAGIEIKLDNDIMIIKGGNVNAAVIDSHNDHRIAMAGGILDVISNGTIEIHNKEAVKKSYPTFFDELNKTGLKII